MYIKSQPTPPPPTHTHTHTHSAPSSRSPSWRLGAGLVHGTASRHPRQEQQWPWGVCEGYSALGQLRWDDWDAEEVRLFYEYDGELLKHLYSTVYNSMRSTWPAISIHVQSCIVYTAACTSHDNYLHMTVYNYTFYMYYYHMQGSTTGLESIRHIIRYLDALN